MLSQVTTVVLAERPTGNITSSTFRTEKVPFESVRPRKEGDVLVKITYIGIEPAMRGWLDDRRSYIAPVQIGATMRAVGVGIVIEVHPKSSGKLKIGDNVKGLFGWADYVCLPEKEVGKIDPSYDPLTYLGPLGGSSLTAYFGLLDVGKLKAGETCVVSGAAGAVGSAACQIAKIKGAKVIAIAGTDDKCRWLEDDLGVDKAINYKSPTFVEDFKKHVGYLDVYFDNVGGDILDLCLSRLNKHARIALCGAISDYGKSPKGIQGYLNLISQSATLQGFVVFDYEKRYSDAYKELGQWTKEGKLKYRFHVERGLEECPQHLINLFKGVNTGKMVVKVTSDDSKL